MAQKIKLIAEKRTDVGKGASRRLRRLAEKIPSILYGGERGSVTLTVQYKEVVNATKNEGFYSQILTLKAEGKNQDVVVRDMQRHPATDKITHIDFMRVDENKALQVTVPLRFINEDICIGVTRDGGVISHVENDVEISCLPAYLPEYIEVDVVDLEMNASIHMSELKMPENVNLVAFMHGEDAHDTTIASVHVARTAQAEEEEELAAAAALEVEAGEVPLADDEIEGDAEAEGEGEESEDA